MAGITRNVGNIPCGYNFETFTTYSLSNVHASTEELSLFAEHRASLFPTTWFELVDLTLSLLEVKSLDAVSA